MHLHSTSIKWKSSYNSEPEREVWKSWWYFKIDPHMQGKWNFSVLLQLATSEWDADDRLHFLVWPQNSLHVLLLTPLENGSSLLDIKYPSRLMFSTLDICVFLFHFLIPLLLHWSYPLHSAAAQSPLLYMYITWYSMEVSAPF